MKCIADIMAPWVFLNSGESIHDFHWHRYTPGHEEWMSIWADHEPWGKWTVEVYPDPDSAGESDENRTTHDTKEEAAQRIAELMEKYG